MSLLLRTLRLGLHALFTALRHLLDARAVRPWRGGPALVPIPLSDRHPTRQVQRRLPWRPS